MRRGAVPDVVEDKRRYTFRHPAFRFIGGNLVSFFGDQIYLIALPLIVLSITGSPLSMGIVAALERLPVILQPLAGVWTDRFNRKFLLLGSDLSRFSAIGLLGILYITGQLEIWHLYAAALFVGVCTQLYQTSQFAILPELVKEEELPAMNAVNSGTFQAAVFLSPGLGGILLSIWNPGVGLILNSFSFLIGALVVWSLPIQPPAWSGKNKDGMISGLKEGFRYVWSVKAILHTNLAMLFSVFGTTMFLTMYIVHLNSTINMATVPIGFLLSVGGITAVAGSFASSWLSKRMTYRTLLFCTGVLGGASIVGFAAGGSFWWLAVMNAVGTGTASISSPCILTIRQQGSPAHLLGRVQATSRFMTWSLMPVSALFAGWLAEVYGTTVPILTGGLLVLSASFFYLHPALDKRRRI